MSISSRKNERMLNLTLPRSWTYNPFFSPPWYQDIGGNPKGFGASHIVYYSSCEEKNQNLLKWIFWSVSCRYSSIRIAIVGWHRPDPTLSSKILTNLTLHNFTNEILIISAFRTNIKAFLINHRLGRYNFDVVLSRVTGNIQRQIPSKEDF